MNELGLKKVAPIEQDTSLQVIAEKKAEAEVQAAFVIAKKFPRDLNQAYMNIIESCKRPLLANSALYAYPRGGKMVTGASIRLAEAMIAAWGNVDCGVREISQSNGVSVAEAYAIDLQTNTRITKTFHVPHYRDTKQGGKRLTDSRDIYEIVANQGARRLRACILAIIPGDVVESALAQCKKTQESSDIPMVDRVRKMVTVFDEIGVKVDHLEKCLGHTLDATIPTEIVNLTSIYRSIKDGIAKREDFFDIGTKDAKTIEDLEKLIQDKDKKVKVNKTTGEVIDAKT